jgi:hypothetical protein
MISKLPDEERPKGFPDEAGESTFVSEQKPGGGLHPVTAGPNVVSDVRTSVPSSDATIEDDTLLAATARDDMRLRWSEIQESFVDDPQRAVENADQLVGEAIQRLSAIFQDTRRRLEQDWGEDRESSTSTENLRQALKRYRTFFDQILSV